MRYDLGRFRRPMRRSTEGQLMSLISLSTGSAPNMYEVWIVGGGGGGGFNIGGGGGAGRVFMQSIYIGPGAEYAIGIGVGGAGAISGTPAMSGGNSSFGQFVASGGGGGGSNGGIGLTGASSGGDSGRTTGTVTPRAEGTDATWQFRGGVYFPTGIISGGAGGGGAASAGLNATDTSGSAGGNGPIYITALDAYIGWGGCGGGSAQTGATLTAGTSVTGTGGVSTRGDDVLPPGWGSGGHGGGRTAAGAGRNGSVGGDGVVIIVCPNGVPLSWSADTAWYTEYYGTDELMIHTNSGTLNT